MVKNYVIHTKDGTQIFTENEVIQNAKEQEKEGITPHYFLRDNKGGCFPGGGWLVWSTWKDGAGVVFKTEKNTYIIVEGWQCDFCYN